MFFPLPALTSFLFGLLFVLSLIIDASYEQMYAEICVWKDPFAQNAERWMSLGFFVSNATAIARPLLFCVLEIVLKSELWTPFYALVLCSEDGDGFSCSVCGSSVYAAFRLSRWSRLHPESFFQQQFQRIYISGWKAAVVTPSYPVLLNKCCIHHISGKECDLLIIISSALQPPSHNRTTFFPLQGWIFAWKQESRLQILIIQLHYWYIQVTFPFVARPPTHTEGWICDSAGGSCITTAISWVQEERANWQPLICAAIN